MKKIAFTLMAFCLVKVAFSQKERRISTYLSSQFNLTTYDITPGNNPWGVGLGLQSFFNNKSRFKPTIEFTADGYFAGLKDLYLIDGKDASLSGMVNFFGGISFHFSRLSYFTLLLGPSFINNQSHFAMKPSFGFYFSSSKRFMGKLSYINVFNRLPGGEQDFGSLSFAVGVKLF